MREQLAALGPVEEHRFDAGVGEGVNLILRLPGTNAELAPLLVGAHYDGPLNSIGADDNASGVGRGFRSGEVGHARQPVRWSGRTAATGSR